MKLKEIKTLTAILVLTVTLNCKAQQSSAVNFYSFADTPPMGWNSWDSFGSSVTEKDVIANADYMAKNLLQYGWNYVVIDIQWYEPTAKTDKYIKGAVLEMDEYGRLLPAPNRFPTTKLTRSFKPIADYVHSKGMKFGLHLMRGIPRQAVDSDNCTIEGTNYKVQDIADKANSCRWNSDMYGVDMTKPGAQEYYNSVFKLYSSWGVDFIKVDDLAGHKAEIEAIRKAINNCGRPIVLSVSMGSQPTEGEHLQSNANMWRISFDFWDNWSALHAQFANMHNHTTFRGEGHWPDADMLPFGHVKTWEVPAHYSKFTHDEQLTVMTLWCIGRSPLMMGGDMPDNDAFTLELLTNDEVIEVNQNSTKNKQVFEKFDKKQYAWVADIPGSDDKYVALFNSAPLPPPRTQRGFPDPSSGGASTIPPESVPRATQAIPAPPVNPKELLPAKVTITFAELGLSGPCKVRDLWLKKDLGTVKNLISAEIPSHGTVLYRISPIK